MSPAPLANAQPFNLPQTLAQALDLHRQGRLAEAEQLYASILSVRPEHFDALHMLGVLKLARGEPVEALRLIAEAMRVKAPSPQILLNHGLALNANTSLDYDRLITPCGTPEFGITSIAREAGRDVTWAEARDALLPALEAAFELRFERAGETAPLPAAS